MSRSRGHALPLPNLLVVVLATLGIVLVFGMTGFISTTRAPPLDEHRSNANARRLLHSRETETNQEGQGSFTMGHAAESVIQAVRESAPASDVPSLIPSLFPTTTTTTPTSSVAQSTQETPVPSSAPLMQMTNPTATKPTSNVSETQKANTTKSPTVSSSTLNTTKDDSNKNKNQTQPPIPTPPPKEEEEEDVVVTYQPGVLVEESDENGLLLSKGLKSRIFARSYETVDYNSDQGKTKSETPCHHLPDGGTTFVDPRDNNEGGWIYASNCEDKEDEGNGGVGAFTFDKHGNVINYKMVLEGTEANCNGGPTPWGAWVSCEETEGGVIWQVDPTGSRPPGIITLGKDGGKFEAFAYSMDTDADNVPQFFVTEDEEDGALRRFRPDAADFSDPWNILYGNGTTDYLVLDPDSGTFDWTDELNEARDNAYDYYPESEGMVVVGDRLYFVCTDIKTLFTLNLVSKVYTTQSTVHETFEDKPDALSFLAKDGIATLYIGEDEVDFMTGIYARDQYGNFYTILKCPGYVDEDDEAVGIAFSPDRLHLYFALQDHGVFFDVTRTDGLRFDATTLPIKFSASDGRM